MEKVTAELFGKSQFDWFLNNVTDDDPIKEAWLKKRGSFFFGCLLALQIVTILIPLSNYFMVTREQLLAILYVFRFLVISALLLFKWSGRITFSFYLLWIPIKIYLMLTFPAFLMEQVPTYNVTSTYVFMSLIFTVTGQLRHVFCVYLISFLCCIYPYWKFMEHFEILRVRGDIEKLYNFCHLTFVKLFIESVFLPLIIMMCIYFIAKWEN